MKQHAPIIITRGPWVKGGKGIMVEWVRIVDESCSKLGEVMNGGVRGGSGGWREGRGYAAPALNR